MQNLPPLHLIRQQCFVGGQWMDAQDGADFAVHNPATGEVIARVACAGRAETTLAIDAAALALDGWKRTPAH